MRKMILTICVCCLMVAASAWGVPGAVFDDLGPGINAPFTNNQNTVDYGKSTTSYGWTWDTWAGKCVGPWPTGSLQRYETTMTGSSTKTAMREDMDWVLSLTYDQSVAYHNETPFYMKYDWDGSRESRIVRIRNVGSSNLGGSSGGDNLWDISIGDNAGGWYTPAGLAGVAFGAWQDITVHYKVGLGLDIWLGSTLVATNQTTGHGRYDPDFMQMEYLRAGTTAFRAIKLAQVCGDSYSIGDLNKDCQVNFEDFAMLAANWLESSAF